MKTKSQPYQNSWDTVKALLRGKFVALDALFKKKKKESQQINNLTSQLKEPEKEAAEPSASRRKEIIKFRVEKRIQRKKSKR